MAAHSSIVGGSTAGRLIECPASWQATMALPGASVQTTSEYAEEGTFAHHVMTHLMKRRAAGMPYDVDSLVGIHAYDREITKRHIDEMIQPALDALDELERIYNPRPECCYVTGVEMLVKFPGVPGAYGTADLILASLENDLTIMVDWKFGAGVGVKATYHFDDGDIVNPQLMYYLSALPTRYYTGRTRRIVVAIIQPRGLEPLTHTLVTRAEIKMFRADLTRAVAAAQERDPPRRRGEHCRFAPCKVACPLWTGPLLDLAALGMPAEPPTATDGEAYGAYLAYAKALVDSALLIKKSIEEQMHAYLAAGGDIPGWRLKLKSLPRVWAPPDVVAPGLTALGFAPEEIWQPAKLTTFAEADRTAKRRKVTIPDDLRIAQVTTETTLTTSDDPAPPVMNSEELSAAFTLALSRLA
jgi:hypothetical protein